MKRRIAIGLMLLSLLSRGPAFAHGGKTHVMGTVTTAEAERLVVKDRDGKDISIRLTQDTKFEKDGGAAAAADLKTGDRVVVDVTGKDGNFSATEVRFSSSSEHSGHDAAPRK